MIRQARRFPLVADNEILIGANPVMSLYDESDLISNIKGPYQERDFVMATEKRSRLKTVLAPSQKTSYYHHFLKLHRVDTQEKIGNS